MSKNNVDWGFLITGNGQAFREAPPKPRITRSKKEREADPNYVPRSEYKKLKEFITECVKEGKNIRETTEAIGIKGFRVANSRYVKDNHNEIAKALGIKIVNRFSKNKPSLDYQFRVRDIILNGVRLGFSNDTIFEELEHAGLGDMYARAYILSRASEARRILKGGKMYKDYIAKWWEKKE